MAKWMKLEPGTMPPVRHGRRFLLMRGMDPDDQIMNTAVRVQFDGKEPYIRYIGYIGPGEFGWRILPEDEYRDCLWQEIEYPEAEGRDKIGIC